DLHAHSLFSDGELLPSELVRRAEVIGYEAIAITDHADPSNYDFILPRIIKVCKRINEKMKIRALPGIEFTHVIPEDIPFLASEARSMGARIIVVHGETIAEPVVQGTNIKALESDIDILAHPGLITEREVKLAAKKGICLEITARKGHCLSNGHVAQLAQQYRAPLVLNTDTHGPHDLITYEMAEKIARGAGITKNGFRGLLANSRKLVKRCV
ncbi:MAG: histidinol phosphate phosphatase domain-containing protein, partial [Pseudomonadota bacterium]